MFHKCHIGLGNIFHPVSLLLASRSARVKGRNVPIRGFRVETSKVQLLLLIDFKIFQLQLLVQTFCASPEVWHGTSWACGKISLLYSLTPPGPHYIITPPKYNILRI